MSISIIAAIGREREMGAKGTLPWHLPEDLKRFEELTSGHIIIMGRKTFESIGHVLPNRKNIILTRERNFAPPTGCVVAHSLEEAFSLTSGEPEIFIIGGAEIFQQALPSADKMYLTIVDEQYPNADTFFPVFDITSWKVVTSVVSPKTEINPLGTTFVVYERKNIAH